MFASLEKKNNFSFKKEKGFVILFAMVISLVIILVSSGMAIISRKQNILSSYTKESQKSFYSANSALECALFHDISPYIEKTFFPIGSDDDYSVNISCGGNIIRVQKLPIKTVAGYTDVFSFRYPTPNPETFSLDSFPETQGCAYVLIEKKIEKSDEEGIDKVLTRITSVGFNTCVEGKNGDTDLPDFNDPRLLERRMSSSYTTYITAQ